MLVTHGIHDKHLILPEIDGQHDREWVECVLRQTACQMSHCLCHDADALASILYTSQFVCFESIAGSLQSWLLFFKHLQLFVNVSDLPFKVLAQGLLLKQLHILLDRLFQQDW